MVLSDYDIRNVGTKHIVQQILFWVQF